MSCKHIKLALWNRFGQQSDVASWTTSLPLLVILSKSELLDVEPRVKFSPCCCYSYQERMTKCLFCAAAPHKREEY